MTMIDKNYSVLLKILSFYTFFSCILPMQPSEQTWPTLPCASASENLTAKQIAQNVFDRDRGENSRATVQMVLMNINGEKRAREFETIRLKQGKLETQLIRFLSPADIRGTGFLSVEKEGWETDQFLYLPALRRTRRIVSSQKSHSFVNSDFSYEDMERHAVDDYTYTLEQDTSINGIECYTITSQPNAGVESQYSRIRSLITKETFVPLKIEFYDSKNIMIKQYQVIKLEKPENIWTEMTVVMENLIKKQKTYINTEKIKYNTDIKKDELSQESLEHF